MTPEQPSFQDPNSKINSGAKVPSEQIMGIVKKGADLIFSALSTPVAFPVSDGYELVKQSLIQANNQSNQQEH